MGAALVAKAVAASELARAGLAPRGLSREQAAAYVGVSPGTFDAMIGDGEMPSAKRLRGRRVWDRVQLDRAFAALPDEQGGVESDDVWSRATV